MSHKNERAGATPGATEPSTSVETDDDYRTGSGCLQLTLLLFGLLVLIAALAWFNLNPSSSGAG